LSGAAAQMSCQTSSTAAIDTASDNANAKPNPITSCAMTFTISPLKSGTLRPLSSSPRSAARGWGHADGTQEARAAALLSLCLRQAFGSGRRERRPNVSDAISPPPSESGGKIDMGALAIALRDSLVRFLS
jgi:hypothetical protein